MVQYYAYTTDISAYNDGDSTYTTQTNVDDTTFAVILNNSFIFNGTSYNTIYVNSNGYVGIDNSGSGVFYNSDELVYNGYYIFASDLRAYRNTPQYIRYKEFDTYFEVIYNIVYYANRNTQVKASAKFYLNNSTRSGEVVISYGAIQSIGIFTELGIRSLSTSTSTAINFLDYSSTNPYTFNDTIFPNYIISNIQASYSNKQLVFTPSDPSCFNEGTKILCLNKNLQEEYIPIENLRKGDLVKSYKHGYRKIDLIGKNPMINDPTGLYKCMYKMEKTEDNGLIEDLIITGGHSILVDKLKDLEEEILKGFGFVQTIDDKQLLLACVSKDFVKLENSHLYTYYHFTLDNNGNDNERFGVWANGILTETPSKNEFVKHNYTFL